MSYFKKGAFDFLFENRMKDSREWFKENRDRYIELIQTPMFEIIEELTPTINKIDSKIITEPKKVISRINRDTRFSKDKSIYRDNVWCGFMRDKRIFTNMPQLWFDISPYNYSFGCGYYYTEPALMDIIRDMIINADSDYIKAKKALASSTLFELGGESYKRPKFTEYPEVDRQWLNMRNIYVWHSVKGIDDLLSIDISEKLKAGLEELTPIYNFFIKASLRYIEEK